MQVQEISNLGKNDFLLCCGGWFWYRESLASHWKSKKKKFKTQCIFDNCQFKTGSSVRPVKVDTNKEKLWYINNLHKNPKRPTYIKVNICIYICFCTGLASLYLCTIHGISSFLALTSVQKIPLFLHNFWSCRFQRQCAFIISYCH